MTVVGGRKQNFSNVDLLDQSAASKISGMDIPASAAAEVLAPLTECALKIEVSIPDFLKIVLIQRAIAALEAGPNGLTEVKKMVVCF